MNTNLKKSFIIISMLFLIIICASSIVSANDIDSINETIVSDEGNIENSSNWDELYVNNEIDESGDGSQDHPFKTVKEAINFGNSKENPVTINIHSGTYKEKEMKITNNMVIQSYDGDVTFDAKNRGWFLYSTNPENNLTLIGLIFKNGIRYDNDDSTQGGVVKTEGHIDVVNCTFEHNFGGTGGGINSHNGANIINSTFRYNKAEYNGAGIYVIDGQTNIINCVFHDNYAKRQGGAIRIQGPTYIENSTFYNNTASLTEGDGYTGFAGNGGAVRVTDGDLNIESSVFKNNSAHFAGGAISVGDDSQYSTTHYQLNINNSTFDGNTAVFGGGIEANDGINLTNSILSNNTSPYTVSAKHGLGSGVYVLNGDSVLSGNTITDNTNPYNSFSPTIYSHGGNVVENSNEWGNDNNRIQTNNGKTTNGITTQPKVNKPEINIYTQPSGKTQIPEATQNTENTPKDNENNKQTTNNDNANKQNAAQNDNSNNEITNKQISSNSNSNFTSENANKKNSENAYSSNNMVKTNNSNELNDVNPKSGSQADIGESSDNLKVEPEPYSESSTTHEISALKSTTQNKFTIPSIIIILIMVLAFIIGYRRKQKEY
jgi:predicted outer membrane repeat protein